MLNSKSSEPGACPPQSLPSSCFIPDQRLYRPSAGTPELRARPRTGRPFSHAEFTEFSSKFLRAVHHGLSLRAAGEFASCSAIHTLLVDLAWGLAATATASAFKTS